jgi:hypothetical protein
MVLQLLTNPDSFFEERRDDPSLLRPALVVLLVALVGWGYVPALFPERVLETMTHVVLGAGYENPEDLPAKEWYVEATRLQSALVAVAGLLAVGRPTAFTLGRADGP